MSQSSPRQYWETAAKRLRLRINSGFLLQSFLPALIALSILQGCLLLLFRRWETTLIPLWIAFAAALFLSAVFAFRHARRRFFTRADALVHLETRLHLHNRLTAATAGRAPWPDPRPLPNFLRWVWQRLALPPLFAIAFLLLAVLIPMQIEALPPATIPDEPVAWQQVDSWAEILEEQDLVEEEQAKTWREQVDRLRQQPAEEWYTHSSLEAGDNLRDTAAENIRQLQNALDKAAFPLTAMQDGIDKIPTGLQPLLQEHWLDAMDQLAAVPLALDKELLAQLAEVDFANLQNLSQEQIDQLAQMLREKTAAAGQCLGGQCDGSGECNGSGAACPVHGTGTLAASGGVSRGPGEAPLSFNEFPSLADAQRREAVSNPDLTRAALGEQLGTTQTAPEVDPNSFTGPVTAGTAILEGTGGEAVHRSRLTPAESEKLKQYFQ